MAIKKKSWEIDRRAFLKCSLGGAGAIVGLPFLEAMLPSMKRAEAATGADIYKRFVGMVWPLGGMIGEGDDLNWWPPQYNQNRQRVGTLRGSQFTLSHQLAPLAPVKSKLSLFSGLAFYNFRNNLENQPEENQTHGGGNLRFLTCMRHIKDTINLDDATIRGMGSPYAGQSIDQIIANYFQSVPELKSPIHSLQLCTEKYYGPERYISFRRGDQPLLGNNDPIDVFNQLFAGYSPTQTAAVVDERMSRRKLVLDYVLGDLKTLMGKLGQADKLRMGDFLAEMETLQKATESLPPTTPGAACTIPAVPPNIPREAGNDHTINGTRFEEHVVVMIDLMAAAFRCNRTRVISYMLANEAHARVWQPYFQNSFLRNQRGETSVLQEAELKAIHGNTLGSQIMQALSVENHGLSHRDLKEFPNFTYNAMNLALREVERRKIDYVAYFAKKLDQIQDGNGKSALSNTIILAGSGLGDPGHHGSVNTPIMTIGEGNGTIQGDAFHQFSGATDYQYPASAAVLHVEIMKGMGVPISLNQYAVNTYEGVNNPARQITVKLKP